MIWVWEKMKEKNSHPHTKRSRIRIRKESARAWVFSSCLCAVLGSFVERAAGRDKCIRNVPEWGSALVHYISW